MSTRPLRSTSAPVAVSHNDGAYIETTFKVTASAAQANGDYFIHLSNPAGNAFNFYQRTFIKSSGTGYVLGLVETSGTGATTTYGTTVLDFGTSHSVDIIGISSPAGPTTTRSRCPLTARRTLRRTGPPQHVEPAAIAAVNLRQGTAANAATVQVDDITVSGVPEPTSLGLVGATLAGLCFRRRRAGR